MKQRNKYFKARNCREESNKGWQKGQIQDFHPENWSMHPILKQASPFILKTNHEGFVPKLLQSNSDYVYPERTVQNTKVRA